MAYFNFLVADMTYDIDPWCDLDLERKKNNGTNGVPVPENVGVEP